MADPWILSYEGYDPQEESLREALCALGNGRFATRGAAEEFAADGVHYPGTYIAGGYNRVESEVAGHTVSNEDLVNFPNWLPLTFRPEGGEWVDFSRDQLLFYRQDLNMRDGVLLRRYRIHDGAGRETSVSSRRIVHMHQPQYAAVEYCITPENWSGRVYVRSLIDGSVMNRGVERYRQLNGQHLTILRKGPVAPEGVYLVAQTTQSRIEVAVAARTRVWVDTPALHRLDLPAKSVDDEHIVGEEYSFPVEEDRTYTVEKVVALHTSRDRGITESGLDARLAITRSPGFEALFRTHKLAWQQLWSRCDMFLFTPGQLQPEFSPEQLILRLHIFHLLQTVSPNSIGRDVSVPARGLHGEAYRGHIFWDELFIFPFFTLSLPEITRSLLFYRYHRLDMARRLAAEAGYRGAMFPWQSSSDGREETQQLHLNPRSGNWDPDHSRLQRHINAAIAYNVWQYYKATEDMQFMESHGAEMLLEIARFWCSATTFNEETGRYEIVGVMGPDEYHEKYPDREEGGLRNNAYTNVMAVWCIDRARDVLMLLRPGRRNELCAMLELTDDELERWNHIANGMTVCFHDGVISQFQGYEQLEEFDWAGYERKYGNIERLDRILKAEGDTPDRYRVSKQADVVMLFYLLTPKELRLIFERLGYPFDDDTIERNMAYYMERTSHGSTLSKVVFSSVLDRIDRTTGFQLFRDALRSDIGDVQGGTTPEGIHLGAMAGTVDIVLRHYAGIDVTGDTINFTPRLPEQLKGLRLPIKYRGNWLHLEITQEKFLITVEENGPQPAHILVGGQLCEINPGESREFLLDKVES